MNPIYIDEDLDVGHNDIADVIAHVEATAIRGNPESALAALDVYGYTKKQHMSVGDLKGKIIDDIIVTNMPKVFVEIGGFLGYLAIRFARLLPPSSTTTRSRLIQCIVYVATATRLIAYAGLSDRCSVQLFKGLSTKQRRQRCLTPMVRGVWTFSLSITGRKCT
ncbi:hypothetical protein BDR26DRAFT_857736 [Obelidium mucronatum]|nr:hypothetical protein BDR26DRAFT_857736 [Obelidium mucronatum]